MNRVECCDYVKFFSSLRDGSVDAVITDPPFGVNYQNNYTKRKHDKLANDAEAFSYTHLAKESFRVLKNNTPILAFTGWSTYPAHYADLQIAGFKMKEPLIVQKRPSGTTDLKGSFQTNSDWLLFAHKGRFKFQYTELLRNKRAGTIPNKGRKPVPEWKQRFPSCWFGEDYPWSSENSSFQKQHGIYHPTIKGLEFIKWIIQLTTPKGGVVLDPFCGSGTTAVAAYLTGRKYLTCDVKQDFVNYALERLNNAKLSLSV